VVNDPAIGLSKKDISLIKEAKESLPEPWKQIKGDETSAKSNSYGQYSLRVK
jgi:hypothetical protein